MSALGDEARRGVEDAVAKLSEDDLTPGRLDQIVLKAAGCDAAANEVFAAAEQASIASFQKFEAARRGRGDGFGCFAFLTVLFALTGFAGVFGRAARSTDLTWLVAWGLVLGALMQVVLVLLQRTRPLQKRLVRLCTVALAIMVLSALLVQAADGVRQWERVAVAVAVGLGLLANVWFRLIRRWRAQQAHEVDTSYLRQRRAQREVLAVTEAGLVEQLDERLGRAHCDVALLDELWSVARQAAEARGAVELERAVGPVGASRIKALLDLPVDGREENELEFEQERRNAGEDRQRSL